jgi:hypothetical protein
VGPASMGSLIVRSTAACELGELREDRCVSLTVVSAAACLPGLERSRRGEATASKRRDSTVFGVVVMGERSRRGERLPVFAAGVAGQGVQGACIVRGERETVARTGGVLVSGGRRTADRTGSIQKRLRTGCTSAQLISVVASTRPASSPGPPT